MPTQGTENLARILRQKGYSAFSRGRVRGVYQFFSFDLVNSTLFKAQHPNIWPLVVTRFYEILQSILSTSNLSPRLWKYVGDEVLFYKHITSIEQLVEALRISLNAIRATEAALHKHHQETKELLSIKGTTWIALAEYIPPNAVERVQYELKNIIIATGRRPDLYERDFLGPDIDIGFRISRFSLRRRLVVSAHLAAVICSSPAADKLSDNFRIVGFEKLKGVWGDRFYPIIWFEEEWETIKNSFLYDELLVTPIAKQALTAGERSDVGLAAVQKVFSDLGKDAEVDNIRQLLLDSPSTDAKDTEIEVPVFKYAEVHCAAVCLSRDGKILGAKRLSTKRRFPNVYEFGCGQLKLGESFAECLRRAYREDFGVNINVADDPTPVSTYVIFDSEEDRNIPGIIFWAWIDETPEIVSHRYVRGKHQSIRWFDANELPDESEDFVPGFAKSVRRAVQLSQQEPVEGM